MNSSDRSMKEWMHYYSLLKHKGIYHSPKYIKVLEKHTGNPAMLFIFEKDDKNFIYYPYFKRNLEELSFVHHCKFCLRGYYDIDSSWYYGGPLVQVDQLEPKNGLVASFVQAFSDHCKESRIVSEFIRFDPNIGNHLYFEHLLPVFRNRETVYIDLTQSEERIWKNMEGRARTAIRKARREGAKVTVSNNKEDIFKFSEIYSDEMARKSAPAHYHFADQFFHDLFALMGGNAKLIYSEIDGVFFSGGVFVCDGDETAHYFLMATSHPYRGHQANSLILHEAILHFKEIGLSVFDFQGGREGVYYFKKSFSKSRAPFFTSGVIHDKNIYEQLVECKEECLGLDASGFFPRYRVNESN